jgi:manganese/zinc/iron transport system permease protein
VAVVVGIQAVGVVLMAALLITPAVTARYWTERLGIMVLLSSVFGALSGLIGTFISASGNNLPTGPLIVLVATAFFVVTIAAAPRRGLLAILIQRASLRSKLRREEILIPEELGEKTV